MIGQWLHSQMNQFPLRKILSIGADSTIIYCLRQFVYKIVTVVVEELAGSVQDE